MADCGAGSQFRRLPRLTYENLGLFWCKGRRRIITKTELLTEMDFTMPSVLAPGKALARAFWAEVEHLVIPVCCPGCGLLDIELCAECAAWLAGPLRRVEQQVPRLDDCTGNPLLPVWALGDYQGPARGMVTAWKDKGREDLTAVFARTMLTKLATQSHLFPEFDLIVPMPSTSSSLRHRGRDHLAPVAAQVGRAFGVSVQRVLNKSASRDQVGLSARARGEAQIRLRRQSIPTGTRVLLFDDVVTTGATLAAARDALSAQGCRVVGALVLAATPPGRVTAPTTPTTSQAAPVLAFSTRLAA